VQDAPVTGKALDALFDPYDRSDAPGLVAAIAVGGKPLYRRALGLASVELGVANGPRTRMRIGSTSKQFAALAALMLHEEGRLDVDAPVTKYLPELDGLAAVPTLRQFMNHTSGLRCAQELAFIGAGLAIQPPGEHLESYRRVRSTNFEPGRGQLYNNGTYHLLSRVIERTADQPFDAFLRERIFEPCGMGDTEVLTSDLRILPGMAVLHEPVAGGGWRRGLFVNEENLGEGGIVSTVDDLLRWAAVLRDPPSRRGLALSERGWRELMAPTRLPHGIVSPYGLGLWRQDYRGVEVIHHPGGVIGGNSQLLTVPGHALDIAIMTNGAPVSAAALAWKVVDQLLADHLREPVPKAGSERFRHLFGRRYHGDDGLVFGFGDVDGRLGISLQLMAPAPVLRDEGEELRVTWEEVPLGPFSIRVEDLAPAADGGPPEQLAVSQWGEAHVYRRLPDTAPDTKLAGHDLPGRFHSADLDALATVRFDGDQLLLTTRGVFGRRQWRLAALSDTLFSMTALDAHAPMVEAMTVERRGGHVIGIHVSTTRTRKLWFERLAD
jgi:CubicO group peptidase (beta-lactamase class C family)